MSDDARTAAPRIVAALPVAFAVHLAEEWWGGFGAWTGAVLGNEVATGRFLWINGVAFVCFVAGTVAALRFRAMAWFGVALGVLFGLNGVLHALATVYWGVYSPGTISGLALHVPLGVVVLRRSARRLSTAELAWAIPAGVVAHGVVAWLAFR